MKKKEEKKEYDLSMLNYEELIETYEKIIEFIEYLKESKIETIEKEKNNE